MIDIEICAPDRPKVALRAKEIVVPGAEGIFAVRAGHTPLLATLSPGVLVIYDAEDKSEFYAVTGGFAEVKDDTVSILADLFEPGDNVDQARAEEAYKRAEERLTKPSEETDVQRAEMALARSLARLNATKRQGY